MSTCREHTEKKREKRKGRVENNVWRMCLFECFCFLLSFNLIQSHRGLRRALSQLPRTSEPRASNVVETRISHQRLSLSLSWLSADEHTEDMKKIVRNAHVISVVATLKSQRPVLVHMSSPTIQCVGWCIKVYLFFSFSCFEKHEALIVDIRQAKSVQPLSHERHTPRLLTYTHKHIHTQKVNKRAKVVSQNEIKKKGKS